MNITELLQLYATKVNRAIEAARVLGGQPDGDTAHLKLDGSVMLVWYVDGSYGDSGYYESQAIPPIAIDCTDTEFSEWAAMIHAERQAAEERSSAKYAAERAERERMEYERLKRKYES